MQAILAETVDTDLWQAQRVLQSASTAPVDLSGCDALSRALDVAAGQAVALSGSEPLLVDRIDAEFRQYFTATGRPTGRLGRGRSTRLRDAPSSRWRQCEAAVAEVDDAVARHAGLTDELARLRSSAPRPPSGSTRHWRRPTPSSSSPTASPRPARSPTRPR